VNAALFLLLMRGGGDGDAPTPTIVPGLEYTAHGRLHYTVDQSKLHYTARGRLHFTVDEEDQ
jgi:hypothetical protein